MNFSGAFFFFEKKDDSRSTVLLGSLENWMS